MTTLHIALFLHHKTFENGYTCIYYFNNYFDHSSTTPPTHPKKRTAQTQFDRAKPPAPSRGARSAQGANAPSIAGTPGKTRPAEKSSRRQI